ncbi:hypothetical protein IFM89_030803 [Coptis chinensis]|uniref:Uncharacterized protein n=1 Tax=Coptis chinensis TaxID=261450 RepID=A0A835LTJ3_9MAGN|nr:hypothetical protein IFM89_030803 [Coptis chinensis]
MWTTSRFFDLVVGNRRFIGEPIFISKGDKEDDGYLLVVEYAVSITKMLPCDFRSKTDRRSGSDHSKA